MRGGRAVAIRPAEPADVEALLAIENAVFPTDRIERRGFLHAIRSPTIDVIVAANGTMVLGYVALHGRRGSRLAHLASIAIRSDAGGQGLGRRLLEAAETAARKRGSTRLRLEVRPDNAPARRLYNGAGYRLLHTIGDYYEDGAAALRYEKELSESENLSTSRNSSTKRRAP